MCVFCVVLCIGDNNANNMHLHWKHRSRRSFKFDLVLHVTSHDSLLLRMPPESPSLPTPPQMVELYKATSLSDRAGRTRCGRGELYGWIAQNFHSDPLKFAYLFEIRQAKLSFILCSQCVIYRRCSEFVEYVLEYIMHTFYWCPVDAGSPLKTTNWCTLNHTR